LNSTTELPPAQNVLLICISLIGNKTSAVHRNTKIWSHSALDNCEAAFNCETYDGQNGTGIRIRPGYEHGSKLFADILAAHGHFMHDAANLTRRDSNGLHTQVDLGNNTINYGSRNPNEAIGAITQVCTDDGCSTDPATISTQVPILNGNRENPYYIADQRFLEIRVSNANFWSPVPGMMEDMIALLNAAVAQGTQWSPPKTLGNGSKMSTCKQTDSIAVHVWHIEPRYLVASIQLSIAMEQVDDAWCNWIDSALNDAATGVGAVNPGFGLAGTIGSNLIGVACAQFHNTN